MRSSTKVMVVVGAALVFSACTSGSVDLGSGLVSTQESRIVGGSTYDGLPAVGALVYNGQAHCTGTLIAPRKVLTAGHCVSGFSASKMQFVIGPDIWSPQATIRASALQAHPNYNPNTIANDIGLVTLASDAPVAPMAVLDQMDSSWVGTDLFFVGYGVDNGNNQSGAGTKRAVWMRISRVEATNFRYEDAGKNTCNGDSGGPAFFRDADNNYIVVGVTSYGDAYCTQYGVDTRADAYLAFLGVSGTGGGGGGAEDPVDPCNGETFAGRCDGNTVVWCENDKIYRQDCGAKVCQFSTQNQYFACAEAPVEDPIEDPVEDPVDPCAGETFEGRCEGESVVWCENEQVHTQDCAAQGKGCVFDEQNRYYVCAVVEEQEPVDPCNGETFEGRCDGNTVVWCENDEVKSIHCGAKQCKYRSAKGYYDCM
ncbi:MAG TPA: trypsin-like serine protease [Myxococcota bacterium]|nr:trypsin-like serine protease [Myxococcota bacterium]HRY93821.1 trypsin-like serine protease [Myxococcota bacterium]